MCQKQSNLCWWPDLELPPINLWSAPMLTLGDIKERLKTLSEIDLLEILEINSEEIVDRFQDKIEDKEDYFIADLDEEEWKDE
jgi:hypothetical protein